MSGLFRPLQANEIECRVQSVKDKGLILLLYKNARADQTILDETVGAYNWKRSHSRDNANCTVSLWDKEKEQWISKEDTGTESNTEAAKGLASDSFKRACTNWGIGRELYTSPFIWVPSSKCNLNGNKCYDKFSVREIEYDSGVITKLVIFNISAKTECFRYDSNYSRPESTLDDRPQAPQPVTPTPYKPTCERCQTEIVGYTAKSGQQVTPQQIINYSKKNFNGGTFCMKCQGALRVARTSANNG